MGFGVKSDAAAAAQGLMTAADWDRLTLALAQASARRAVIDACRTALRAGGGLASPPLFRGPGVAPDATMTGASPTIVMLDDIGLSAAEAGEAVLEAAAIEVDFRIASLRSKLLAGLRFGADQLADIERIGARHAVPPAVDGAA